MGVEEGSKEEGEGRDSGPNRTSVRERKTYSEVTYTRV